MKRSNAALAGLPWPQCIKDIIAVNSQPPANKEPDYVSHQIYWVWLNTHIQYEGILIANGELARIEKEPGFELNTVFAFKNKDRMIQLEPLNYACWHQRTRVWFTAETLKLYDGAFPADFHSNLTDYPLRFASRGLICAVQFELNGQRVSLVNHRDKLSQAYLDEHYPMNNSKNTKRSRTSTSTTVNHPSPGQPGSNSHNFWEENKKAEKKELTNEQLQKLTESFLN